MKRLALMLLLLAAPAWADMVGQGAGVGGGIGPTTGCTGSSPSAILFMDAAVINCADGPTWNKTTKALGLPGSSSGVISVLPQAAAGTYNFNLPTTAGTSGQVLTSGGGGAAPMTWSAAATGTVTGTGTSPDLAVWSSSSALTNYAGSACAAGTVATAIDAAGAVTCVTAGSTNITNVTGGVFVLPNKSSTGTTLNKIAKLDTTASPATAVIAGTSDTVNLLGVVVSGAGTTGNATVLSVGQAPCVFDNSATVGHYVVASVTTAGDCHDSGSSTTYPTGVAVLGIVAETGAAGTRQVDFNTPDVASASAGPNGKGITLQVNGTTTAVTANLNASSPSPDANNVASSWKVSTTGNTTSVISQIDGTAFTNFAYNGKLTIKDIHADNASFTVANRIHYVTTGASAIAATMPASPTVGDTYTIVKADSGAGTAVWTRAGSQTLNGATTRTVSAQYKSDTCVYMASNVWICQGDGA
jgi:hypothetical protein